MNEIMDNLMNYQDKIIVRLIDEGLSLEEIAELNISNVDSDKNELHLENRTVKISQLAIEDIMKAYHEVMYFGENGESEEEPLDLVESKKIVRGTENEKGTLETINERIKMIEEAFELKL